MRNLKYIFLLAAFAILGLSSCTKEEVTETETENPTEITPLEGTTNPLVSNISPRSSEGCDLACFVIDYPFSITINDESTEITADTDLETLFEGLNEDDFIDFVYPLNITFEDGETGVIDSGEDLGEAFARCIPDGGWGDTTVVFGSESFPAFLLDGSQGCISLQYPVNLIDLQGLSSSAASEQEFIDLLASVGSENILFFSFPITVVDQDGNPFSVEDGEALFEALVSCDNDGIDSTFNIGGEIGCYDVEFPFSVTLADGTTVQVNNHDEFCALMLEGEITGFVYPFTLINTDGTTFTVNNEEELDNALDECDDFGDLDFSLYLLAEHSANFNTEGCYEINYPLSVSEYDTQDSIQLTNDDELLEILSSQLLHILQYPVSIILASSGDTIEILSGEELQAVVDNCQ